jgi:DNA-binding SARP family transcriptional activator
MLGDKDGPLLQNARHLMAHGGMDAAINAYSKLIKRAKFLEEVIYDLKEATYTHPVDVIIWQTLGDAHMRANQLQDALDAYTRAEELLR